MILVTSGTGYIGAHTCVALGQAEIFFRCANYASTIRKCRPRASMASATRGNFDPCPGSSIRRTSFSSTPSRRANSILLTLRKELQFYATLQRRLGEQRIDIVVHRQGTPMRPIDTVARRSGVRL